MFNLNLYKLLNKELPLVNPESSVDHNPKYYHPKDHHHHAPSEIIKRLCPFYCSQWIKLEFYLGLEHSQRYIQMDNMNFKPLHHYYQSHNC